MGVLIVGMVLGATSALASYFFGASAFWILITYIAAANVATIVCAIFVWLCPGRESKPRLTPVRPNRGVDHGPSAKTGRLARDEVEVRVREALEQVTDKLGASEAELDISRVRTNWGPTAHSCQ